MNTRVGRELKYGGDDGRKKRQMIKAIKLINDIVSVDMDIHMAHIGASLLAQTVKRLPAMWDTQV